MLLIEGECAFVLCVCFEFWLSDHHSHRNACIRMYDDCVFVSSFGYPTITHTRMHVSACMMQIPTAYISVYEN